MMTPAQKRRVCVLIGLFAFLSACIGRASIPALRGYVNDYANILSPGEEQALSEQLRVFEEATSNQIFILTIPSLEGKDIETYSVEVAEAWKPGQKGKDNGIVIVVAPNEREYRIEVGYGLEGVVPDGLAGEIGRRRMKPAFQRNAYAEGITAAVEALIAATKGEYKAEPRRIRWERDFSDAAKVIGSLLFVLFWGLLGWGRRGRRTILGRGGPPTFWGGPFGGGGIGGGFGGGGFGGFGGGGGGGFGGGGASGRW